MSRFKDPMKTRACVFACLVLGGLSLLTPQCLFAGWTDSPQHIQGPSIGLFNGDWVSNGVAVAPDPAGLNTYYSYFIEVPPGTGEMRIYLYDADIGAGTNLDLVGATPNTSVNYTVIDPSGATATSITLTPGSCPGCDGAWAYLTAQVNPMVGHWELRIDQSTGVQSGGGPWNDINVLYVYALDVSNGVELNLYSHSYSALGNSTGGAGTVTYDLFPWVTCGCEVDSNDFDGDVGNSGTTESVSSRSGATTYSPVTSGATNWANNTLGGFTTDFNAVDYGIWHTVYNLTTTAGFPYNWATYYVGNWNAADPSGTPPNPPTAQPEANTTRVYYTTTAGGGGAAAVAPPKEYAEQMLTWVSGPNPPVAGRTTVVEVSIRVVNPTAYPIAFSRRNTVRSWVPGGGAVYAGNAEMTQGSLLAQPAIGGTGAVDWNPGSVAAGATALEAYRVSVTPSASGQRIPVTGAPGANGTTATYVDGTCAGAGCSGAQLAGATFSFGELCELAITENLLTHTLIRSFKSFNDNGETVVQWQTASEAATMAFQLYREDPSSRMPIRVGGRAFPGLLTAPQGGVYRLRDPGAAVDQPQVYWLEEREFRGRTSMHGPFRVESKEELGHGVQAWPVGTDFESRAHTLHPLPAPPSQNAHVERTPLRSAAKRSTSLAIGIRQTGVYRLSASEIAGAMGTRPEKIRRLIRSGHLQLKHRGSSVSWRMDEGGDSILFYAEAIDSIYTAENVYVLSAARMGRQMELRDLSASSSPAQQAFLSSRHVEEDLLPATALGLDPESDYWFWKYLLAGDSSLDHQSFDISAVHPMPGQAHLNIKVQGASDTGDSLHRAEVVLNGSSLGFFSFSDFDADEASFDFDAALLEADGNNSVEVYALSDADFSLFFVDSFDLLYPRSYEIGQDSLAFDGGGHAVISLQSPHPEALRVFDVSNPLQAVEILGSLSGDALVLAPQESARYLAVPTQGIRSPDSLRAVDTRDLLAPAAAGEYLVLTPQVLLPAARQLARYRAQSGMKTTVVKLETVMDQFNDSIFDPWAIRNFLAQAREQWVDSPRYLLLLGSANLDYRDLLGLGGNLMPALMLQTSDGLYAADNLYSDFDGDGIPEISTGRIPLNSTEAVSALIEEMRSFENDGVSASALIANDRDSGGANFHQDAMLAAAALPSSFEIETINLQDEDIEDSRSALLSALNEGKALLEFFGHGGADRLSEEALLSVDDLDGNLYFGESPVVSALACSVNRFDLPGFPALGTELLDPQRGGAVAVWAPSGLSSRNSARVVGRRFNEIIAREVPETLGEVVDLTLEAYASMDDPREHRLLMNLLGDPALVIHFEPDSPPDPGPPDSVSASLPQGSEYPPGPPTGHEAPIDPAK